MKKKLFPQQLFNLIRNYCTNNIQKRSLFYLLFALYLYECLNVFIFWFSYSINHADKSIAEIAKLANEQVNLLPIDHFYNPKDIDWDYISKSVRISIIHFAIIISKYLYFQDGLSNRSSVDCKLRWINSDHPGINNSSWNKTEDKNLLALVKKYKNQDWESIADELGVCIKFFSNK